MAVGAPNRFSLRSFSSELSVGPEVDLSLNNYYDLLNLFIEVIILYFDVSHVYYFNRLLTLVERKKETA